MITTHDIQALVELLQRTPMTKPEQLFASGLIEKLMEPVPEEKQKVGPAIPLGGEWEARKDATPEPAPPAPPPPGPPSGPDDPWEARKDATPEPAPPAPPPPGPPSGPDDPVGS